MVEPYRPQTKRIRRMRIACWINKTRDNHSENLVLIAFHGNIW
jgi:hypothetical protein